MSLVVDTSVIISVLINEKSKNRLIQITEGENLIAPTSLPLEIGNAFSAMFKRKKISLYIAKEAIENLNMIPIKLIEVDIYKSIQIAHEYNIYAYDAYFLECARSSHSPLLTLDGGMVKLAKQMNIIVREV